MESTTERFSRIPKKGVQQRIGEDIYHSLLKMSWTRFIVLFLVFFFSFNLFFAFLFFINPESIAGSDGSLFESFAFSVQTFSTVGYGVFSPKGYLAHCLVILESTVSVLVTAVLTGLVYAKFSRPRARVIFSKNILITKMEGRPTLIFRAGNLRANQILEATAKVVLLKGVKTAEGVLMRKQFDISLHRSETSFFALSWVLMHTIDEKSPLYGMTQKDLIDKRIEIGVSLTGHDETFSQTVFANCLYSAEDFVYDRQFKDVLINNEQGRVAYVDYTKFHDLV